MIFKPVGKVLVSDEIIEEIKQLIMDGTLKPGDRLPSESEMASQMGVGRSTIREALKVLIYLGFIERQNKVAYVSNNVMDRIYPKDIIESFKRHRNIMEMIEARRIIEPDVAEYAAMRANPNDIEEIGKYYQAMKESQGNVEDFISFDNQFHLHVIHAARNNILMDIMKGIQELMKQNQALILRKSKNIMPRSLEFHRKIFIAIKEGKAKSAKRYMLSHIIDVEKEMYCILKEEEG
ncbi:MAG: hypothetical protein DRP55_01930 [Spirochaetes bacterium]|nr:MAG: hypothetical protein DRP55_01930 [Spirochaetota bacterium]